MEVRFLITVFYFIFSGFVMGQQNRIDLAHNIKQREKRALVVYKKRPLLDKKVDLNKQWPYRLSSLSVEERVDDLLQRMTLEEKIAQIRHVHSWNIFNGQELDEKKLTSFVGNLSWGFVEGFPLTGEKCRKNMRAIQKYMLTKTRLGIPIFTVAESLHGSVHEGSTIYPQNIALGSTFNPELAYRKTWMTSSDLHAQGIRQVLAPCIDVVRDLRWGRVEESYGEDPFLCGVFAQAEVKGYLDNGISPMLKHYGPHGNPLGGLNLASVECGTRDLHNIYLRPFEMVINKYPVMAVMSAYNSWNQVPNSASRYLLTEVLRNEWGFKGYVYSDWGAIGMLESFHHTASNKAEAAVQAISAGLDVEASSECYPELIRLVKEGKFDERIINESVRRVLTAKFHAGLFEDPYGDQFGEQKMHSLQSIDLSRKIADESTVLLKNEKEVLPLDADKLRSIAVLGPNAAQVQFGDYTWSRNNEDGVTPLDGIRTLLGKEVTINYARGCSMMSKDTSMIAEAVNAARKSEVALIFCGSSSTSLARDYSNTNCGEGFDLHDLELTGAQSELIKAVYGTGKPVILILVSGKPFVLSWEKEHLPAIVAQWYAGEQAGNSIADILFGKVNPSGHLTFSFPQSAGHLPAYYNYLPTDKGYYHRPGNNEKPGKDYVFASPEPLWAFGHGLSYSTFAFEKMSLDRQVYTDKDTIRVKIRICNTGNRRGKEVVQIYVRDFVSSVVTPVKQLKAFAKVDLNPAEDKELSLLIPVEELAITDERGNRFVESGAFDIQAGNASDNIILRQKIFVGDVKKPETSSQDLEKEKTPIGIGPKIVVTGLVRDVQAAPVDDVVISSSAMGKELARSDKKGEYRLTVASDDVLLFTKKGYQQQIISVGNHSNLNIRLNYEDNIE